jgi:type IV pilus assembly protein PilW
VRIMLKRNKGFSLIEVMTTLVLGLVVLAMVIQLFMNTKNNHAQNDRVSETLESGRYALRQLSTDLKEAGFLGGVIDPSAITIDTSLPAPATDCGTSSETNWAYDLNTYRSLQFDDGATPSIASASHTCIQSSDFTSGTDVLVVKRVYNQQVAAGSLSPYNVYLRSDYNTACLWYYDGSSANPSGTTCPTTGTSDWLYITHIYYIRKYARTVGDGIPTLCRKTLGSTTVGTPAPTMTELCLAEGVEHFHVMFGIDTDTPHDGIANQFISNPTATQLRKDAVSARIYVLARAKREDTTFVNNKTYTLGDRVLPAAGQAYTDKYYRRLYSTTVLLRNPMYTSAFNDF